MSDENPWWTELDRQADEAARAWAAENGGWPGVAADRAFRAGWKAAAESCGDQAERDGLAAHMRERHSPAQREVYSAHHFEADHVSEDVRCDESCFESMTLCRSCGSSWPCLEYQAFVAALSSVPDVPAARDEPEPERPKWADLFGADPHFDEPCPCAAVAPFAIDPRCPHHGPGGPVQVTTPEDLGCVFCGRVRHGEYDASGFGAVSFDRNRVIVCVADETPGPRGTKCPNALHDHPLPSGYVAAGEVAATRLRKRWANVKCPDCGLYGWRPGFGVTPEEQQ